MLQQLAQSDSLEVVKSVQEFYGDYIAINRNLFSFDIKESLKLCLPPQDAALNSMIFKRTVQGILAVLLSLKRTPIIRFQQGSAIARQVAKQVDETISTDDLFDFRRRQDTAPVLLILDRREDPVTPILSQWTYQAQVHELLGLDHNRVDLSHVKDIDKDQQQVVLSVTQDKFFEQHMHANFGDLGMAVKKMLDEYQKHTKSNENIQSIEDMQRFLENYPAFRSHSLTVSKHVAVMGELSAQVDRKSLMEVSTLEQQLATQDAHGEHMTELKQIIHKPSIGNKEKLRLALLYALRYERSSSNQISLVKTMLLDNGLSQDEVQLIDAILEYGGAGSRSLDLYGDAGTFSSMFKNMKQGLGGMENGLLMHKPLLTSTLDALFKGKLKDAQFPSTSGSTRDKPRDVIVFIIGGCTFEEETAVAALNEKGVSGAEVNVLLGGSCIQNSTSFLAELGGTFGANTSEAFDLR